MTNYPACKDLELKLLLAFFFSIEFIIHASVSLQLLAKLLKSKNPDDLQAANRLIKNMVKQVRVSFPLLFKSYDHLH